jgi:hypothetical protein
MVFIHHQKVEYLQKYAESEDIVASSYGIIQITRPALLRVSVYIM